MTTLTAMAITGAAFPSGWVNPAGAYQTSAHGVRNGSGHRAYFHTAASDFHRTDFDFAVTFDTSEWSGGENLAYIGLGDGAPYGGFYDEPGQAIGFHIHLDPNDNGGAQYVVRQDHNSGDPNSPQYFLKDAGRSTRLARPDGQPGGLTAKGRYTAEIVKRGDALTFTLSAHGRTLLTTRKSLSHDAPFLNASNSRLFFGTGSGSVTFSDIHLQQGRA